MPYRMTLGNSRTGNTYIVTLAEEGDIWQATWYTVSADGVPMQGPHGTVQGDDAEEAFDQTQRCLEDEDPDIIGVDWQFEEPCPPWLVE